VRGDRWWGARPLAYLAGADPKTPLASPLFASLSGLPPLLVQVGTADLLLSDSERFATAATGAGVDVTLQVGQGCPRSTNSISARSKRHKQPSGSGSSCGLVLNSSRTWDPTPKNTPSMEVDHEQH
jgi:acetyl esterase/lipase